MVEMWIRYALCLVALTAIAPGCGGNNEPSSPAATALEQAREAAEPLKKYAFEMSMDQKLGGAADPAQNVKVVMKGIVEREPLKLDQTIDTTIDGEASNVRTVIVPEGYYMYLPDYEEWSKLSADVAAENTATLSDFQVDPARAMEDAQALAGEASVEEANGKRVLRYDGTGPEAKAYALKLLESTMGLSDVDKRTQDSLKVSKLKLEMTMDAAKHWPLSYKIESDLSVELEAGKATTVGMTVSGGFSQIGESAAVVLPEEAKGALSPEEIDEQLGDDPLGLKEGEEEGGATSSPSP